MVGVMSIFDQARRTYMTRDIVFSQERTEKLRIRGIYNMSGDIDTVTSVEIDRFVKQTVRPGSSETVMVEKMVRGRVHGRPLMLVSVVVFDDQWSMNMFFYDDIGRYRTFVGKDFAGRDVWEYAEFVQHLMN